MKQGKILKQTFRIPHLHMRRSSKSKLKLDNNAIDPSQVLNNCADEKQVPQKTSLQRILAQQNQLIFSESDIMRPSEKKMLQLVAEIKQEFMNFKSQRSAEFMNFKSQISAEFMNFKSQISERLSSLQSKSANQSKRKFTTRKLVSLPKYKSDSAKNSIDHSKMKQTEILGGKEANDEQLNQKALNNKKVITYYRKKKGAVQKKRMREHQQREKIMTQVYTGKSVGIGSRVLSKQKTQAKN